MLLIIIIENPQRIAKVQEGRIHTLSHLMQTVELDNTTRKSSITTYDGYIRIADVFFYL